MRKTVINTFMVLALAAAPAFALAQDTDANTRQTTNTADDRDHGEWGWLGLLGLAGLMGLKRRNHYEGTTRDRATAR